MIGIFFETNEAWLLWAAFFAGFLLIMMFMRIASEQFIDAFLASLVCGAAFAFLVGIFILVPPILYLLLGIIVLAIVSWLLYRIGD